MIMADENDGNLVEEIFNDQAVDVDENRAPAEEEPEGEKDEGSGETQIRLTEEQKKMLGGRFETVDDVVKAFREGEKWWTQTSQQSAALKRELEELRKTVAPEMTKAEKREWDKELVQAINAVVVDEDPKQLLQLIDKLVEEKAEAKFNERYRDLAPIAEQYRFQREINEFLTENPEAQECIPDMVKLLEADPELVTKPNWLDKAYAKVLKQKMGLTQKAAADSAAKNQAAKQAASISGSGARPTQSVETEDDKLLKTLFGEPGRRKIFDD